MHGKARILILIGGHLWTSPRSQKEAEVLAAAGYDVTINGVWFDQSGAERDSKLLAGKAWAYRPILDLRADTPSSRFCNLAVRARRRIESKLCSGLGARFPAALGYGAQQFRKAALRHSADLTIVHSEPNLWVGSELLDRGRRVGVDFEDWFSEDLRGDEPQSEAMRWLQELEGRLARECSYSITTSRALSGALAARYSAPLPAVVYNVFPFAEASAIDRTFHDRKNLGIPSVHWFSQTIGPGRGLEMFFAATRGITEAFEVHLRGKMALGYADSFNRLIPDHIRERVFIHDTVPNAALLSRISEHDIGLALETSTRASRNLSITNKVFQYLQGGLAILATRTEGQAEVFAQEPDVGLLMENNDVAALTNALSMYLTDRKRLEAAQLASVRAAERTFCWEQQRSTIIRCAERALVTLVSRMFQTLLFQIG